MKSQIQTLITQSIATLQQNGDLSQELNLNIQIERTRDKSHGDFACNIALMLSKQAKCKPRDLAEKIVAALPAAAVVTKVDIAGPGFINFFINEGATRAVIGKIFEAGEAFGHSAVGGGKRVQVEFVSANPTGPLHVGHGRGAAYGATVADLLTAVGFEVHREYYVNDAGRQMNILAASTWLRYLEGCGEAITFPVNGYKGQYIYDIAAELQQAHGETLRHGAAAVMNELYPDEGQADGDKELHIDALVERSKTLLGAEGYKIVFDAALNTILKDIREDLQEFGVIYEKWFSENSLVASGAIDRAVARLKESGHLYQEKGAWWFRSTDFGDEKDRVVIRENGQTTYFASDIAYHMDKLERGFDQVIDVWGADHHGYVPRVKAALQALGDDVDKLDVLLVQFAILYRGGVKAQMSTRSGEFVTLRQLRDEVGNDAARFFYVLRRCEQHMDFDLDLAKSQSNDNPVYYIQYAHARVCSVLRQLDEKGFSWQLPDEDALALLDNEHELALISRLTRYPEVVESAALSHEPHQLAYYLRDLANDFHTYYNAHQFIVDDAALRHARIALIKATRQVISNGLGLLGVSTPEKM
ncbi:MAG: arginine--tRNA ligase [Thiotrichaceae bacterium]|nr:arginine--tRNA ligase [Thiotrichaceae bacterium]PCI13277.1 MAG: arginine--tRNA ligase [Thiotrichales bacterium]